MEIKRIKYNQAPPPFILELRTRINAYLKSKGRTRFADWRMHLKTVILMATWFSLYGLIMSNWFQGWDLILVQVGFHWMSFVVWNGISHDAHHWAYTKNKVFNRILTFCGDLTGVSSYVMDFNHVKSHHSAVNIPVHDVAIDDYGIMRFHPSRKLRWYHRWQHLYINFFYITPTLFKLFLFDHFSLMRTHIGAVKTEKHPVSAVVYLTLMKLAIVFLTLVLPILVLDAPAGTIVLGFLLGHFVAGITLSLIFQITHLCDFSRFTQVNLADGNLDNSFALHVLENTSTFSPDNLLMSWISGGLNHHTLHHLFPDICQIHFSELTPILRETAQAYGIPFKVYPSFYQAIRSHYSMLRKLGREAAYTPAPFTDYKLSC